VELEIIEKIYMEDKNPGTEKRYRIRVKGTNIVLNIRAETAEKALEKARQILEDMKT
jgi:hypothetical protein